MTDSVAESRRASAAHGFWVVFIGAWVAFAGLFITALSALEGQSGRQSAALTAAWIGPLFGLAVLVALQRHRLLRPEWSVMRTTGVLLSVGVAYAVVGGLLTTLALRTLMGTVAQEARGLPIQQMMTALFLYVAFAGFMMWTESVRRFHESRSVLAREAMLRAQAEAKAIRAQFNPHFVFNTLHSLMLLVRADPPTAERAIEDVGELIRYASMLQRREVDQVPLAKELEVVRRYLALERLRLGDRLHVVWDVDEGLETRTVPPFSVQTLVENAIKHGLEPSVEGGTVTISVREDDGVLAMTVSDDGVGGFANQAALPGHGLDLLGRRLRALYRDAADISWSAGPSGGFTVTICLPPHAADPPSATGVTVAGRAR